MYHFILLKMFANLTHLTLSSTAVTNRHFQQIVNKASDLEYLDIPNCTFLDQSTIFHGKNALSRLEYANISSNCEKFTILAVACLCSYEGVQTIVAHGYLAFPRTNCCSLRKRFTPFQAVHWTWTQKIDATRRLCCQLLKRNCMRICYYSRGCCYSFK